MNIDITSFYLNIPSNTTPILDQVLNADHDWLEHTHNWCQRAFPNYEPSEVVFDSPILDDETLKWLKIYQMENILKLTFKYLNHFGAITEEHEFPHNNRRITRLIKFLKMLDLHDTSLVVYRTAMNSKQDDLELDSARIYWQDALNYKREK